MSKGIFSRFALLLTAIIWGSSLVVVSTTADILPPNSLLAIRFGLACVLLCFIFLKKLKEINLSYIKNSFIIGFCLFLAYSVQTIGVTTAGGLPGRSAFLSAAYCVIVPFLIWIILRVRPDRYNIIAGIICIIGIGLLSVTDLKSVTAIGITKGDIYALLSAFLFAGHICAVSVCGKDKDPILITILQFFWAAIFSFIITLIFEDNSNLVLSNNAIYSVLYLAIFCTAIALLLQNIGQKYTSASTSAIILGLESFFGILFSVIFTGETLTVFSFIGCILIFLAIIISETKLSFLNKS